MKVLNTAVAYADEGFFDLFTFKLIDGTFKHDKSQVIISDKLALKYFNTTQAAGKQITQNNKWRIKRTLPLLACLKLNHSIPVLPSKH